MPRTERPLLRISDEEVLSLSDDIFVARCTPFVQSVVGDVRRELRLSGDKEDMLAAGFLGLVQARSRFEPTTRAEFSTFAYWRIRGAIIDSCRKGSATSRRYQERMRAAANHSDHVANEEELSHQGVTPRAITAASATKMLADHITNVIIVSGLSTNFQYVFSPATQENSLIQSEMVGHLKNAVEQLSEVDREILYRLYYLSQTFEEIGLHFEHTKSWASRAHSRIVAQIQKIFRQAGIIDE